MELAGIYCALWTPTDRNGEILWTSLDAHLRFVLENGVQGIMALGSTGEFVHFTLEQRKTLLERIVRECKARQRQVIANVSDVQPRNVVELAEHAKSVGADCLAVLPPWFFPLGQRDLAEFFIEVARGADAPIALYNFPEVTGKKIELETIERVARSVKVVAVKQSGAEFGYHQDLLRLGKQFGFRVLTGADTRLEETLRLGCAGTVSGLANCVPELLTRILENSVRGVASKKESGLVDDLARLIGPLQFPLNVKAAIEARGFTTGTPKLPMSESTATTYQEVVQALSKWYKTWVKPLNLC